MENKKGIDYIAALPNPKKRKKERNEKEEISMCEKVFLRLQYKNKYVSELKS